MGIFTESGTTLEGKPFCVVRWDGEAQEGQMSPDEMRQFGLHCLEAAEAAETDAMMLKYFTEKVGIDEQMFGQVLKDLRVFREEARGLQ